MKSKWEQEMTDALRREFPSASAAVIKLMLWTIAVCEQERREAEAARAKNVVPFKR